MDGNGELKLLCKFIFFLGGGVGSGGGEGASGWGVRVDVNGEVKFL